MNTTTTPSYRRFLLATVALLFATAGLLRAGTAGIQDNAGFFSEAAKADATGNINLAQRTLHKDVEVETFATVPDNVKASVNLQDKAAVGKMMDQWALQRFHTLNVNGVYLLIVKDPAHLQVEVGTDTQKEAFTLADREVLVKGMLEKLRAKDYDGALRHGVSFVVTTMKKHAPNHVRTAAAGPVTTAPSSPWSGGTSHSTAATQPSSGFGGWGWIIALIVIFFIFRIVMGLFRALFGGGGMSGGGMGTPMGGQMGGGGGGFLRSLMGGVLGAAAGSWLYDSFLGSHGSSAYGASQDRNDQADGGGFTGQDTDASGSGGGFGGDDSGSSSGGGFDSGSSGGGGDFGGGGGGDSGGGGGGGDF